MQKSEVSKLRIGNTLIQLLQKYPIDQISITLLCKEAQVSRSAFYNNYKHIEDVLKDHYYQMHYLCFHHNYKDVDYIYSDQHLKDFINFFDINSDLLLALMKWNLLPYIAKYNTEIVIDDLKQCNDEYIREHSYYYMIYYCSKFFYLGVAWLGNGKQESKDELFEMIKRFQDKEMTC